MSTIREIKLGSKLIKFEFNKYAKQANGSVMVSSGGTQVLVTVCAASEPSPDLDFFPLSVDFIEKFYSAGRLPGGFVKREGKPSDLATLQARLIDRPLRPCFPKEYRNETIITATVLSYEHGFSPAPLALAGASMALMISDIPFNGPVAGLTLGLKDGEFVIDPLEGEKSDLDLSLACRPDAILMVEAGANFLTNAKMLEAIEYGHKAMAPLFELQLEIAKELGKPKMPLIDNSDKELSAKVFDFARSQVKNAYSLREKIARNAELLKVKQDINLEFNPNKDSKISSKLGTILEDLKSEIVRENILNDQIRIDGRGLKDIRKIDCEIGPLSKTHGSSLFTRGETQSLAAITLAALEEQQKMETLWESDLKQRFMLHYNFPPFCVGEARMQRPPGRREIGHGSLARRALLPAIPDVKDFAYSIRVVAETLESNGSSSMAAVCSGYMGLMQAGVPMKQAVAGIAMGLIKENDKHAILSDILGDEDHLGDMDFKVCGSKDTVTALQMDIKISGISMEVMKEALEQAQQGRQHILNCIQTAISEPCELSANAPRIFKLKIKPDQIRDLIGPGGKTIKKITLETGCKVDVEDGGIIGIIAPDATSAQAAKSLIRSYISQPQMGDVYLGKVVRIVDFGVFVELRPGLDGLCHITQLDEKKIQTASEVVKIGEEILVKIIDIDRQGRIKLSRKEAMGEKPSV